jgi:hypothetical protein
MMESMLAKSISDDLQTGDLPVMLAQVPDHPLCPQPRGRPVSRKRVFAWRDPGIDGIRLECQRCPSGWFTTAGALTRFHEQLTQAAAQEGE